MSTTKIAISIEKETLQRLDRLVREKRFPNRSRAIQLAVLETLDRIEENALARECAKLDRVAERNRAEEGLTEDMKSWPEY